MAFGVYIRSKCPRGPLRERSIATKSPTTTEGIDIKVYSILEKAFFPLKSLIPKCIPMGIKIKDAIMVADVETNKDKNMISYISLSKDINKFIASLKP